MNALETNISEDPEGRRKGKQWPFSESDMDVSSTAKKVGIRDCHYISMPFSLVRKTIVKKKQVAALQ